jgi:uncharacterized protein YggU (UPF0235/DUF167 family)
LTSGDASCLRRRDDGIDLFVRLTPKSAHDRLEGLEVAADGRSYLKARVRAVPEKGAANAALEKLVAKMIGVAASTVSVSAGGTARLKTLHVSGDPSKLTEAFDTLLEKMTREKPSSARRDA